MNDTEALADLLAERDRLRAEAASWKEQLWALARVLNCLPSTFSDANAHVYRKAEKVMAELEQARADVRELVECLGVYIKWCDAEINHEGTTFWERVEMCRHSEELARVLLAKHALQALADNARELGLNYEDGSKT